MATFIVLLGPPGAGKGTQAKFISINMNLAHISSGDLFRENINNQTKLGNLAKEYIDRGDLVPDDVTIDMVRERLKRDDCRYGALLDGFPRTPAQAEALDSMLGETGNKVDIVPYIYVPPEILIKRLAGRWTCPVCGRVYHELYNPPRELYICDDDTAKLYQRDDDRAETVEKRIRVYMEQTEPLIEYYKDAGTLRQIDGTRTIDEVTFELLETLIKE